MLNLENRIEDLQDELELAAANSENHVSDRDSNADDGKSEESSFMSESIYGKLSSPKQARKRKSGRRISMPILHEYLDPGQNIKEIRTHADNITGLDFDVPFGTMVTAALDDTVRVWDLNTGRCLGMLEGHHASVRCLQVEDNIVATGSADASIRLWDLSRAESYKYTPPSTTSSINKRTPASTSASASVSEAEEEAEEDGVAPLTQGFNTPSMSECQVFCLDSHVGEVTALYFQGDTLVSGSADKTLRQWDLVKGRCVQTLDVLWAAAQSNMDEGKWRTGGSGGVVGGDFVGALQCFDAALACGTADGMVRLWDCKCFACPLEMLGYSAD